MSQSHQNGPIYVGVDRHYFSLALAEVLEFILIHTKCKGKIKYNNLFVSRIIKFNMKQRNTLHCNTNVWPILMGQTHIGLSFAS